MSKVLCFVSKKICRGIVCCLVVYSSLKTVHINHALSNDWNFFFLSFGIDMAAFKVSRFCCRQPFIQICCCQSHHIMAISKTSKSTTIWTYPVCYHLAEALQYPQLTVAVVSVVIAVVTVAQHQTTITTTIVVTTIRLAVILLVIARIIWLCVLQRHWQIIMQAVYAQLLHL